MKKNDTFIQEYKLDDFFEKTIGMLKYTWKNSLIIGLIFFAPVSYLFSMFVKHCFSLLSQVQYLAEFDDPMAILQLFSPIIGYLFASSLLFSLATYVVQASVTYSTYKSAFKENLSFQDIIITIVTKKLLKLFLLYLVVSFILFGVFLTMYGVMILMGLLLFALTQSVGLAITTVVIGYITSICLLVYLSIKLSFSYNAIVCDDCGVFDSLAKSMKLVKGSWWRVFGITLLISMVVNFASSIIVGPIMAVSIMPMYSDLITSLMNNSLDPDNMFEMFMGFQSFNWGIFLNVLIKYFFHPFQE